MLRKVIVLLPVMILGVSSAQAEGASIASAAYVDTIVTALGVPELAQKIDEHIANVENPHAVTAEQVGLGNVQNVDNTNADNLTSGTVNVARLPVGTSDTTVASGADGRFDSLSTTEPTGTPPDGRVYIWFN